MDALDKNIVKLLQEDFPLVREPYKLLAQRLCMDEDLLLERVRIMKEQGKIRKMGAVLQHREVGYASNALCAWLVPEGRMDAVASQMSQHPFVSHCYDRNAEPDWPYNLYTMLHAHSRKECEGLAEELGKENNLKHWVMLFTVKEWKKTSMRYFCEG